jgi:hypothetical protein
MSVSDYIPHVAITALGAVIAWVGKDHFQRDDSRFRYMADAVNGLNDKMDKAIERQADNHAEILKLFVKHGE